MAYLNRLQHIAQGLSNSDGEHNIPFIIASLTAQDSDEINFQESSLTIYDHGNGFLVRTMTLKDMEEYLPHLEADLVISRYDVEALLRAYPKRPYSFVGEYKGQVIMMSTFVLWTKDVVYMGSAHVRKEFRNKGFVPQLWTASQFQKGKGVTGRRGSKVLVTDSLELNIRRNWPMSTGGLSAKYSREAQMWKDRQDSDEIVIKKANEVPLDNILTFDSRCFLKDYSRLRKPFLEQWIQVPGGASFVALDRKLEVVGFVCRRPALQAKQHLIGPLYAQNKNIAHSLLARIAEGVVGEKIILSIRMTHPHALHFVLDHGFEPETYYVRRYEGTSVAFDDVREWVYGVTSLACCGF